MNCTRDDIVLLPFPFTDLNGRKVRPAVVVGLGDYPGDLFLVPLTSQIDRADLLLNQWESAGLNRPSAVKSQIATIESSHVLKIVGRLSAKDSAALNQKLRSWLSL